MSAARLKVFKRFTEDLTTLSKCKDKKVACIITDAEGTQVYSIGINGGAKGGPDCLCELDGSRYTCVHAEANALAKCTATDQNKVVISSFGPCVTCAALMVNSGVRQFYYIGDYKSDAGLKILIDAGVYCENISDEAQEKRWLEGVYDVLNANGFIKLTRTTLSIQRFESIVQACMAEGKRRGKEVLALSQPDDSIIIEWRWPDSV